MIIAATLRVFNSDFEALNQRETHVKQIPNVYKFSRFF